MPQPPDKAKPYIGFNAEGHPFILRYSEVDQHWFAMGYEPDDRYGWRAVGVRLADDKADFIVRFREAL